jgi:CheY-like chemotaxis protein
VSQDIKKQRVLVVDDETDMRVFLSNVIETGGYDPIVAINGTEGLKRALNENPDLIIVDMMMPQEDGLQMYQNLKYNEMLKHIPVIMLSSIDKKTFYHYQQVKNALPGKGVPEPEAYLEKPPEAEELLSLIHDMLIKRKIVSSLTGNMK